MAERDDSPVDFAPRRIKETRIPYTRYEVVFSTINAEEADRIIVRMDEDKETDEYVVGQDLAKMGVSSVVPQMWIDRYDSRLCINTAVPTDNQADYPLSLFAPVAGDYDNYAIWNLTSSPYILY